ncbi:hypothetical protein H2200_003771 [Cladophialophora chaetospira]|uniref:Roadblock/LAMTOR2 domain-containing protein n=1 Tax=Cladophialophora chaetospira TaxID=386627 RepID=A0AA38XFM1_9EURO|nr:hypothetical protein H2200_003771 [Cladophialophora chaetospira]
MAPSENESLNGPSIDAMLRGLTERPNVQFTLILSRRDGSIIRATGLGPQEQEGTSASGKPYQWAQARESNNGPEGSDREGASAPNQTGDGDVPQIAKPVEILAASIFQFVNNANMLGETLGTTSRSRGNTDGPYAAAGYAAEASRKQRSSDEDTENTPGEDGVQLLRLRTKHQEIIIFPDSNYICCVVQRIGNAGVSNERR